jgi:polyisoprenoid-binding protein YceI
MTGHQTLMTGHEETTTMTTPTTIPHLTHLTGTYTIDPAHTQIGFIARHAMVTKVRGAFNEFEGTAALDGHNPATSTTKVTIKTASIDTRNAHRDEHLRSNDFLAIDTYPEITFVSTALRPTSDTNFELTGDLTIKGITNSVRIPLTYQGAATDPFGNPRVGFEGSVTINRKDYDVTWNATLQTGGVLISDKITLEFEVSAVKNT